MHPPQWKNDAPQERTSTQDHDGGGQIVEGKRAMDRKSERRRPRDRARPFLPAGEGRPPEGHREDQGREGEREQGEVDAAPAQGQEADDQAHRRGEEGAEGDGREHVAGQVVDLHERGGIGSQPEERAVAEGKETRVAQKQVEAQAHQGEDRDLGGQALGHADGPHGPRQQEQRRSQEDEWLIEARGRAHSKRSKRSPRSPRGRTSRTSTMRAYIEASAAGGEKSTVRPPTTPPINPAPTTPPKPPSPPITPMTKAAPPISV